MGVLSGGATIRALPDRRARGDANWERSIKRGLLAPLSPHEEVALRRIALGISNAKHLPAHNVAYLVRLRLVDENDGRLSLTALGRQRYDKLPRPMENNADADRGPAFGKHESLGRNFEVMPLRTGSSRGKGCQRVGPSPEPCRRSPPVVAIGLPEIARCSETKSLCEVISKSARQLTGKTKQLGFLGYLDPTEVDRPPSGEVWAHEIKWDGYRAQAHLTAGRATVYTRKGNDWTARFGPIARAIELLPVRSAILDGEAVALDRKGVADFHELHRRQLGQADGKITYKAFDLLWLNGKDLRPQPWSERKSRLQTLIEIYRQQQQVRSTMSSRCTRRARPSMRASAVSALRESRAVRCAVSVWAVRCMAQDAVRSKRNLRRCRIQREQQGSRRRALPRTRRGWRPGLCRFGREGFRRRRPS